MQGDPSRILEEYKDAFPNKMPYGPTPRRVIYHEIEMALGLTMLHKCPYKLKQFGNGGVAYTSMWRHCLSRASLGLVQAYMAHPLFSFQTSTGNGACALMIRP